MDSTDEWILAFVIVGIFALIVDGPGLLELFKPIPRRKRD